MASSTIAVTSVTVPAARSASVWVISLL